MFLAIGGTNVDLIEGGTNVGGTNVCGRKVASSIFSFFKLVSPTFYSKNYTFLNKLITL
jgi:hypothetical protein